MKQIFNEMPDKAVIITGAAFALAVERVPFKERLVELGILTAEEILELHEAAFNKTDFSIAILRDNLNKINDFFVKEYNMS